MYVSTFLAVKATKRHAVAQAPPLDGKSPQRQLDKDTDHLMGWRCTILRFNGKKFVACLIGIAERYLVAGLFIFEGPDGAGKTSVIRAVEKRLHAAGVASNSLSFPGKERGTLGAHVYDLHHDQAQFGVTQLSPLSLQLLHVAAHVDTIEERILPLTQEKTTILLDRCWWSTWAYGIMAGIPRPQLEAVISVEKIVWRGVVPTTLFLLSRTNSLLTPTLSDAYQELAKRESANYPVIPIKNDSTVDAIADKVTRDILDASV